MMMKYNYGVMNILYKERKNMFKYLGYNKWEL